MNYDSYARQVGGALPDFVGAQYQRGLGLDILLCCVVNTVALGKGIKRPPAKTTITAVKRRRERRTSEKRERERERERSTMAFVHIQSCEGVKSELDLFKVPPTQNCIIASHVVEHQPTASLDSGGPIEFLIPGSGDDYIDLSNTMIHVQVKVTQPNGNDLDAAAPVGPVNNWLHSLWSQVDVSLNGTLVTQSSNTYAYRAYVETLLTYGLGAKSTQLTNQLWYKDMANRMSTVELAGGPDPNPGFVTRREYITGSRVVDMMGRLHVDMFLQDKFLINGVHVKIRLVRSKPSFALMSGGAAPDYKITINKQPCSSRRPPSTQPCRWLTSKRSRRARSSIRYDPSPSRCTPFPRELDRTRTRTCSSVHCRNVSYCAASTTTPTTARTIKTRFMPRTTP